MSRRLGGALLLVVVALAVAIMPAAGGIRVAGDASPAVLPPPPAVGQCLQDSVGVVSVHVEGRPIEDNRYPARDVAATGIQQDALFATCGVGTDGEVAAVSPNFGTARDRSDSDSGCRTAVLEYTGLVPIDGAYTLPGAAGTEPVAWNFSIDAEAAWVAPSRALRAAGLTWAACVVNGPDGRGYFGSLRNAFNGGTLPDRFGTCWRSEHLSAGVDYVDCRTAHRSELIATGTVSRSAWVGFDAMVGSCGRIAARAMGHEDPTLAGQLRLATSPGAEMWNRANRRSSSVVCYVTSTSERQLFGSLIGIRDKPVRWAG